MLLTRFVLGTGITEVDTRSTEKSILYVCMIKVRVVEVCVYHLQIICTTSAWKIITGYTRSRGVMRMTNCTDIRHDEVAFASTCYRGRSWEVQVVVWG